MSELPLPETIGGNKSTQNISPEMASMLENFNKKSSISPTTSIPTNALTTNGLARQNLLNSASSNSSVSKSSQQVSSREERNQQIKPSSFCFVKEHQLCLFVSQVMDWNNPLLVDYSTQVLWLLIRRKLYWEFHLVKSFVEKLLSSYCYLSRLPKLERFRLKYNYRKFKVVRN